jgi:hypothetical protein
MAKRKFLTKKIVGFVVVVIIAFVYVYYTREPKEVVTQNSTPDPVVLTQKPVVSKKEIKEENFSGSTLSIAGESILAKESRKYVVSTIDDFRKRANEEVPDLKKQFGPDVPTAEYSIDMDGTYLESDKTQSLVIGSYVYTGGANGMSLYKVFTASKKDGHIIPITEAIKKESQTDFVKVLKDDLMAWKPEGMDESPVFKDEVEKLTLKDMANWSLDNNNLYIYFDKYTIGPGALGPVTFPLPIYSVKQFINI